MSGLGGRRVEVILFGMVAGAYAAAVGVYLVDYAAARRKPTPAVYVTVAPGA